MHLATETIIPSQKISALNILAFLLTVDSQCGTSSHQTPGRRIGNIIIFVEVGGLGLEGNTIVLFWNLFSV